MATLKLYMPIAQGVTAMRNASRAASGGMDAKALLSTAGAQVDQSLAAFQRHLESTGDPLAIQKHFATLQQAWSKAVQAGAIEGKAGLVDPVVEAMKAVQRDIADHSRLTLDPEEASYYVMSYLVLQLPDVIESAGQVRGYGAQLRALGQEDVKNQRRFIVWDGVTTVHLRAARDDAARAVESAPQLKDALNTQSLDEIASFQKLAAKAVLDGESTDAMALWNAGTAALQTAFGLYDKGLPALDTLLQERESATLQQRNLLMGLAAFFVAMALYLFACFYKVMMGGLQEVSSHLSAMTQGDLTTSPRPWGRDEVASLMNNLSRMQEYLTQVVGQVRRTSDTIVHSSSEIASGTMDLSARTEQTASHLEQTAAAMEQMTSTVQHTAEAAAKAAALANDNAQAASRGGEVIGDVVATMENIQQSSRKIEDITGVIDSIAFQTNILALNAAVEAARAGEQGRGFAVVASEVRALAQRSASAAREIKGLISASVAQVESGTRVVQSAGETMTSIVSSAQSISTLLADVAHGTREQSQGVAQVGAAVQDLDRATQQNAALVEESAAAAGALRDSALSLATEVSLFKLTQTTEPAGATALLEGGNVPADFDFDAAIEAHRAWKVKLRSAISRKEQLDAATIARDDCCPLGKWIHGNGGHRYGSKPRFTELLERHRDFHSAAGDVARTINQGQYDQADRMLGSGSAFSSRSNEVSTVLTNIKRLGL